MNTIVTINDYANMLKRLKNMDEKQLLELFHDIDDLDVVEGIADCAYHFIENYDESICNEDCVKSDNEDAKEADDARRFSEYQSDNKRPY